MNTNTEAIPGITSITNIFARGRANSAREPRVS